MNEDTEMVIAMVGLLDYVTTSRCKRIANHYTQKPVADALRALCKETQNSSFAYDYLDVVDKIKQSRKEDQC